MSEPITRIEAVALARKIMAECEAGRMQEAEREAAVAFDEIDRLESRIAALTAERDALQTRVAELEAGFDKTADGVPVTPNMVVFMGPHKDIDPDFPMPPLHKQGTAITMRLCGGYEGEVLPEKCYSTLEAALAAAKESGR